MATRMAITDKESLTKVIMDTWAACWTNVKSLVSRDTRWPVVSRVSRAKSALMRWANAASWMSVVMRMTMRAAVTWCR